MGSSNPQGALLQRQCSLPHSTSRGNCVSASALPHFEVSLTPPDLAEDVVLEASFARGLAGAECFEVLQHLGPSLHVLHCYQRHACAKALAVAL